MGRIVRSAVVSKGRPGLEAVAGAEDDEGGQNGQDSKGGGENRTSLNLGKCRKQRKSKDHMASV